MYKKPAIVMIKPVSGNIEREQDVESALYALGVNTGNLLFSDSLRTVLKGAHRVPFSFSAEEVSENDVIVLAAANWISPHSDLGELVDRLEAAQKPVIPIGLGAQLTSKTDIPNLKAGTQRFVEFIAQCPSVSVRGEITAELLSKMGLRNIEVTGCPSLLLAGKSGPQLTLRSQIDVGKVTLHSTRHLYHRSGPIQDYLFRQAIAQNFDLLLQSELADMMLACSNSQSADVREKIDRVLPQVYDRSFFEVSNYLSQKGRVFFDLPSWVQYASKQDFTLGTRVHGTIASLLSGTPAKLIAHDTRTLELAHEMSLPVIEKDLINTSDRLDIHAYYDMHEFARFLENYGTYRNRFLHFFEGCGLDFANEYAGILAR